MSDTDSLDYLQSEFDPSSLTVPRLRSILVSHDIDYPSGAKKPQLVQIFTDNVLPQSRRILNARARARRTSRGIIDAESSQETNDDDDEEAHAVLAPTPRARMSRVASSRARTEESDIDMAPTRTRRVASSRARTEESDVDMAAPRSPTKRSARTTTKHPRASESEAGTDLDTIRPSARQRRSEAPTPAPEPAPTPVQLPRMQRPEIDEGARASRRESAFTFDNPFQSGSSPPAAFSERKRKSLGPSLIASREAARRRTTSTSTSRRRTDGHQADDFHPPTSATFEIPVSALRAPVDIDENGVEASEEFTAEEEMELVRERASNGQDIMPPRRQQRQQSRGLVKGPLAVAFLTIMGGYATWYRQEKIAVGYCGVGRDATPVIPTGVEVPDWARILVEPQCEPCPLNAFCSVDLQSECIPDFVKRPHPLSFAGLVPLPPTCEPDGEKFRKVKAVADRAVEELRERKAKFECGDLLDEAGFPEPTVVIDAEDLKAEVSKKRRKGMSEGEFQELWTSALGEIEKRDEIETTVDGDRHSLSTTSLARLPLGCSIRRHTRLTLARHRYEVASLMSLVALFFYIRSAFTARTAAKAAIPHLVSLTLDRLASQAALSVQDPDAYPEPWISIGQMRDDVLRDEHSIKKREALWSKVRHVVEMNANVRTSQREGRNGEVSRVWEWIGAVGALESGGERRRKSGRVSWGAYGDDRSSPVSGTDPGPEVVQSKWQEGRPIY